MEYEAIIWDAPCLVGANTNKLPFTKCEVSEQQKIEVRNVYIKIYMNFVHKYLFKYIPFRPGPVSFLTCFFDLSKYTVRKVHDHYKQAFILRDWHVIGIFTIFPLHRKHS